MRVTVDEVWKRLEDADHVARENPRESRETADRALALLAELAEAPSDLRGFAAQIDGTAWRVNGHYKAAERCYTQAESIYCSALAACEDMALRRRLILVRAELRRRWSFLCLELLDWDRGLRMLDFAEERFAAASQWHEVGRVYLARGQLLWERAEQGDQDRALEFLSRAVEIIDPEKREAAFMAAEHNCAAALTLHPDPSPESLDRAFKALQRSRLSPASKRRSGRHRSRQRFGHAELTVPDAKRRYLQGKILLRLHQHDEARPFLETSRKDLMLLGNYQRDVFAVALDLVECYLWIFRRPWGKVAALLAEMFALCPVRDLFPETQAALELFQTALEARSLETAKKHLEAARRRFVEGE